VPEGYKHFGITPFIIADDMRKFYYLGLQEWRQGSCLRLLDTCRTAQDIFIAGLRKFVHCLDFPRGCGECDGYRGNQVRSLIYSRGDDWARR